MSGYAVPGRESRFSTPHGEARTVTNRARNPVATLLLCHGAGGGIGSRDLAALATALPRQGVTVVCFEQPWVLAGRKVASSPPTLDDGLRAAAGRLRSTAPLILGGRSAGARSAARSAHGLGAVGCLALAFPLHPPGHPEKTRLDELVDSGCPTLVVQGERDPFGGPDEFPGDTDMCVIPGGDHGFAVPKRGPVTEEESMAILVEATLEWMIRGVIGESSGG